MTGRDADLGRAGGSRCRDPGRGRDSVRPKRVWKDFRANPVCLVLAVAAVGYLGSSAFGSCRLHGRSRPRVGVPFIGAARPRAGRPRPLEAPSTDAVVGPPRGGVVFAVLLEGGMVTVGRRRSCSLRRPGRAEGDRDSPARIPLRLGEDHPRAGAALRGRRVQRGLLAHTHTSSRSRGRTRTSSR